VARLLDNLGIVANDQGDYTQAQTFHEESLVLRRQLDDKRGIAIVLSNLGEVAQNLGKSAHAIGRYVESLSFRAELGDKEGIAYCLEGLAEVAGSRGQPKRAARLWGAAAGLRERIGAPMLPATRASYEQKIASARAQFDGAAFDAAFAAGRGMSLDQVAAEAKALTSIRLPDEKKDQPGTRPMAIPVEPDGPRLVLNGATGPRTIALGHMPLTIGRESNVDVVLDDPRVSRQHARLSYRESRIWLTDLRSSNGTFVNGEQIQEQALQPGDLISFGGMEAIFEDSPQAGTQSMRAVKLGDQEG
jgi:tetratricopeptide (TPR) repeat protein